MTGAACRPLSTPAPIAECEQRPDRFAELFECMGDLLVETRRQRVEIARLTEMERSLEEVGVEVALVHQLLQHVHLI
jgi:hypothetical protein